MDVFSKNSEASSSCSNPSEPPDIRNWFSSYKYESFVLDTCENFGGIYSEENESAIENFNREKEENFDGSEEIRNVDKNENFNSKEDSLHSLSVLSEPSDIRKWYSSYVYESPLLDTNDGFNNECEKDELVDEESIEDGFADSYQSQQNASDKIRSSKLVKCIGSLADEKNESHPLFSEPLGIENWFPDYVYESPALDTSDEFKDTLAKDTESSQDRFDVEGSMGRERYNSKTTTTKTECRDEVVIGNNNSPLTHDEQEHKDLHWDGVKGNLSWQDDACFKNNSDPNLEIKQELSCSINIVEDSISEINRVISKSPGKSDGRSLKKLTDRKCTFKNSSDTKVETDKGSNDKENIAGKDDVGNGFITTKNKSIRSNDENSQRGHEEIRLRCSVKQRGGEKDCGVNKRKVLAETTNVSVEQQCDAKAMEITGKWRCPQKSKPPRGPPLKQLRLERWIHRG